MKNLKILLEFWKVISIAFLNSLVILAIAEVVLRAFLPSPLFRPWNDYLNGVNVSTVYPGRTSEEVEELLVETWNRPLVHRSFVEFMEGRFAGRFVNVNKQGFREQTSNPSWPPSNKDFNIFFFGGSTTFGYGVADEETIPWYVEKLLSHHDLGRKIRVYNFGQAAFFSGQERILFSELLLRHISINMAVFIDGLNEIQCWDGEHYYFYDFKTKIEPRSSWNYLVGALLGQTALGRTIGGVSPLFARQRLIFPEHMNPAIRAHPGELAEQISTRYLGNVAQIETLAAANNITVTFVLQPVPFYGEWPKNSQFTQAPLANFGRLGFSHLVNRVKVQGAIEDLVQLQDLGREFQGGYAFVDWVHYSPSFAELIAERISKHIVSRIH